jgi:hypothetical protein
MAAGFSIVMLATLALGAFAFTRLQSIGAEAARITDDTLPCVLQMNQVELYVKDNFANTLRHVVTDDPAAKAAFEATMKETTDNLTKVLAEYERGITIPRDRERGKGLSVEAGVGVGLTAASDALTFKLLLSRNLNIRR